MPEECFICSTNHRVYKEKGRALSNSTSVWVSDACYKCFTHPRNVNKTMTVNDKFAGDHPNQSLRDVIDRFHSVTERIVWYAKVSLVLILHRKNLM